MSNGNDFEPTASATATALETLRRAAWQGATSVTSRKQLVADAVAFTVDRWIDGTLRNKDVRRVNAWAFAVAANAAKRLGRKTGSPGLDSEVALRFEGAGSDPNEGAQPVTARQSLLRHLVAKKTILRGRQFEVAKRLCEPGMTLHRAARELAMDRSNLRRCFRAALRRLFESRD